MAIVAFYSSDIHLFHLADYGHPPFIPNVKFAIFLKKMLSNMRIINYN